MSSFRSLSSVGEKEPEYRVYHDATLITQHDCSELQLSPYADRETLVILNSHGSVVTFADTGKDIDYCEGCLYSYISKKIYWQPGESTIVIGDTEIHVTTTIYLVAPADVTLVGKISFIDDTILKETGMRTSRQIDLEGEARNGVVHKTTMRAKYSKAYYIEGDDVVRVCYFINNNNIIHIRDKMPIYRKKGETLESLGIATLFKSADNILYFITDSCSRGIISYQGSVVTNISNDPITVIYHTKGNNIAHVSLNSNARLDLHPEQEILL